MYNKYSYMSDLYLIPKTCTRTCSIFRISGVCGRSFLKIDVGVGVGIPGGGTVVTHGHGPSLCDPSVLGARCEWSSSNVDCY